MNTVAQCPELVDIGVNLAHRSFVADRDQVIRRAFAAWVRTMVVTGTSVVASEEVPKAAASLPGRDQERCLLGVASSEEEAVSMILRAMKKSKVWH